MKFSILLNELLSNELCGFFDDKTNIPDYDSVLFNTNEIPRKLVGRIVEMSPDEYFKRCAKLQGTSVDEQYNYIRASQVNSLFEKVKQGVKLNMGYIDYDMETQEGRHRVMLAKKLGCETIPVAIFLRPNQEDPFLSSKKSQINVKNYKDVKQDSNGFYVEYDFNTNDILKLFKVFSTNFDETLIDVIIYMSWFGEHLYKPYPINLVSPTSIKYFEIDDENESDTIKKFLINGIIETFTHNDFEDWEINDIDVLNDLEIRSIWYYVKNEFVSKNKEPFYKYLHKLINEIVNKIIISYNKDIIFYSLADGYSLSFDKKNNHIKLYIPENFLTENKNNSIKELLIDVDILTDKLKTVDDIHYIPNSLFEEYLINQPYNNVKEL